MILEPSALGIGSEPMFSASSPDTGSHAAARWLQANISWRSVAPTDRCARKHRPAANTGPRMIIR